MCLWQVLIALFRWLTGGLLVATVVAGCASPVTTTPIQAGGHNNAQQTGGFQTHVTPTVAPVITVTQEPAERASVQVPGTIPASQPVLPP